MQLPTSAHLRVLTTQRGSTQRSCAQMCSPDPCNCMKRASASPMLAQLNSSELRLSPSGPTSASHQTLASPSAELQMLPEAPIPPGTFRFALFDVKHDRCAQPTGTDSMLLGSWSLPPSDPPVTSILDIGTGSGVLALMMAQHTHGIQAVIHACEVDHEAAQQAAENAAQSPWSDRVQVYHASLQQLARAAAPMLKTHSSQLYEENSSHQLQELSQQELQEVQQHEQEFKQQHQQGQEQRPGNHHRGQEQQRELQLGQHQQQQLLYQHQLGQRQQQDLQQHRQQQPGQHEQELQQQQQQQQQRWSVGQAHPVPAWQLPSGGYTYIISNPPYFMASSKPPPAPITSTKRQPRSSGDPKSGNNIEQAGQEVPSQPSSEQQQEAGNNNLDGSSSGAESAEDTEEGAVSDGGHTLGHSSGHTHSHSSGHTLSHTPETQSQQQRRVRGRRRALARHADAASLSPTYPQAVAAELGQGTRSTHQLHQVSVITSTGDSNGAVAHQQPAAQSEGLPFNVLARGAALLLAPGGHLSVVLPTPAGEAATFTRLAQEAGLRLVRRAKVFTNPMDARERRQMLLFQKPFLGHQKDAQQQEGENSDHKHHTQQQEGFGLQGVSDVTTSQTPVLTATGIAAPEQPSLDLMNALENHSQFPQQQEEDRQGMSAEDSSDANMSVAVDSSRASCNGTGQHTGSVQTTDSADSAAPAACEDAGYVQEEEIHLYERRYVPRLGREGNVFSPQYVRLTAGFHHPELLKRLL